MTAEAAAVYVRPHVVVGVGGTSRARSVVNAAAREAVRRDCDLIVVHVVNPAQTWPALAWFTESLPFEVRLDAIEAGMSILETAAGAIEMPFDEGLHVETQLYDGPTIPTLVELSRGAQLLVVGGGALHSRPWHGSVVRSIVGRARCPVRVVPDRMSRTNDTCAPWW